MDIDTSKYVEVAQLWDALGYRKVAGGGTPNRREWARKAGLSVAFLKPVRKGFHVYIDKEEAERFLQSKRAQAMRNRANGRHKEVVQQEPEQADDETMPTWDDLKSLVNPLNDALVALTKLVGTLVEEQAAQRVAMSSLHEKINHLVAEWDGKPSNDVGALLKSIDLNNAQLCTPDC